MGISIMAGLSNSPLSANTMEFLTLKSLWLHYLLFQQESCKHLDITKQAIIQAKKRLSLPKS